MIEIHRAAARYLQMNALELTIRQADAAISDVEKEIDDAEARRAELRRVKRDALEEMRKAALDEGQLPLPLLDDLPHNLSIVRTGAIA